MENSQQPTANIQHPMGGASWFIGCSKFDVGCWMLKMAFCLAAGLALLASRALAQPDVEGNPDSSAFIRIPSNTDDWTRHFRIGALVGMNISASFSQNGLFNVNRSPGVYDDGYVLVDNTGNAGGQTAYWGYDNNSQYNPANQTLSMHSVTSFSASGSGNTGGGFSPGIEMAYGGNLWYWKHARVGWELGFGWLPVKITERSSSSAQITQSTYVFNTGLPPGVPLISAPYQGLPSGGTGEPTIFANYNLPVATTNFNGTVAGSRTLDVTLYTVRLGPSFYWDLTEHVGMSLGAGPAVGIVSGDYKYDETVNVNGLPTHPTHNAGQIRGTDVVFGGYVNGTLMYHVQANGNADIFVSAQYMPMGDATISGGGRAGRLNFGGQLYVSVGINWPF
jgi:hypothetical protein